MSTPTGDSKWKPDFPRIAALWHSIKFGGLVGTAIAYLGWITSPRLSSSYSLNETLGFGLAVGLCIHRLLDNVIIKPLGSEFARYYRLVIELLIQRRFQLIEEANFKAFKNHLDNKHFVGEHITVAPPVVGIQTDSSPKTPEVELQRKTNVKRPRVVATQKTFPNVKSTED